MRVAVAVLLSVALAGCSGDDGTTTGATTTVEATPGDALDRFVKAAGRGDAEAMWAELSSVARERYGSLEEFRSTAIEFSEGLGSFALTDYERVVDEAIDDRWGVAAIAGEREVEGMRERNAYAAATVLEGGEWKLELGGLTIDPVHPAPNARSPDPDRAVARVVPPETPDEARMWVDGRELENVQHVDDTITAPLFELPPGPQAIVVFAAVGTRAGAQAWTFENVG